MTVSKLYIALPVMNENERLSLLISSVVEQSFNDFRLVICVNQPDSWWQDPIQRVVCEENQLTIRYLNSLNDNRIEVIDKSSPGCGWQPGAHGIGFARKLLMDHISSMAGEKDCIISMDADTVFEKEYFASVIENIRIHPEAYAISVPYYHNLSCNSELDRAMLRYEIYMRAYAVNMWRISSPYSFTALGSAIAFPVWAYRKVGGMTPKLSGEDFYFLQKIVKTGHLMHWNSEFVYPATRLSDRVFFGTGPALIKGLDGDWSSYPVYSFQLFDKIAVTYDLFGELYKNNIETPLDSFLMSRFGELPWDKLRKNYKTCKHFIRACHEKIDGLRILQFLKESQPADEQVSEMALADLLFIYREECSERFSGLKTDINFSETPINDLNLIRDFLFHIELKYRKLHWGNFKIHPD